MKKIVLGLLILLGLAGRTHAVFNVIVDGDPVLAAPVMQNFRHVNYGSVLKPVDTNGNNNSAALDLGTNTVLWRDLYLSGTANVGAGIVCDTTTLVVDPVNNRVGIGTASPERTFDIANDSDASMQIYDPSGNDPASLILRSGSTWAMVGKPTSGTNAYGLEFQKGGVSKVVIDTNGYVGIGTSSPAVLLDVSRGISTGGNIGKFRTGAAAGDIVGSLLTDASRTYFGVDSSTGAGGAAALAFLQGGTEIARFDSSGRLGIGLTSVSSLLMAKYDDATNTYNATQTGSFDSGPYPGEVTIKNGVDNTVGSFAGICLLGGETSDGSQVNLARISAIREAALDTSLAFTTRSNAGGTTEKVRITSAGKVGIGTTTPTQMLDVVGTVSGSALQVNGAATITGAVTANGGVDLGGTGTTIKFKKVDIGTWDMDATASLSVAHGLTLSKILGWQVSIYTDGSTSLEQLDQDQFAGPGVGIVGIDGMSIIGSTTVVLWRTAGDTFDSSVYNDTGINRGYILIWYVP